MMLDLNVFYKQSSIRTGRSSLVKVQATEIKMIYTLVMFLRNL